MAYRHGDRNQMTMLPQCIEDYVEQDAPVRAYDAFVEALDFKSLGIQLDQRQVGNPQYDPKAMLKLLVYGYSYGVKSSRKLEREVYNNLSFIWLMGGLKPDHKTIAEFRRKNKKALKNVLRQCVRLCIKLDLIAGNVLFVDGSKIRANARRDQSHDKKWYERKLSAINHRIDKLLEECEATDRQEDGQNDFVSMGKGLKKSERLKETVAKALAEINKDERKEINKTDPDCAIMHSLQGSHAAYNVQSVVDDENGLIVHAEAVSDTNDAKQFARQINQANDVLDKPCKIACADAGYSDVSKLEEIDKKEIKVIVPSQRQALHKEERPFSKRDFTYDPGEDCYICPEGHRLRYSFTDKRKDKRQYRMEDKRFCHRCRHYGQCTKSERGRNIIRLRNEEVMLKLEAVYEAEESQKIYARRKSRVELPFGHIKRNLKTDAFLLRGRKGVQAETSLLATCFNLARMMTVVGVNTLTDKLKGINMVEVGC